MTAMTSDDTHLLEGFLSSRNLSMVLPFHFIVDRTMRVVQCGDSIASRISRTSGQTGEQLKFKDVFQILEPELPHLATFDDILALHECSFVLELRSEVLNPDATRSNAHAADNGNSLKPEGSESFTFDGKCRLVLRSRVVHMEEADRLLFVCSPRVSTLDDLEASGLDLNEIPGHDPTYDVIIWNELLRQEKQETAKLAGQIEELRRELDDLEKEKTLSDRLLYSILPPSVADQLRSGAYVEAARYDSVSILFSGICEFGGLCLNCQPIDVVNLLNDLYRQFDDLAQQTTRKVYKVETVGDKYMLVSGLPEKHADHAVSIAMTALDMLDIGRRTVVNGYRIRLTVGVHSGEAVAGVVGQRMPHYAVFGGAVCQASRMESTGLPDSVNISEATYRILIKHQSSHTMQFKERGLMTMKGFNELIRCYLLNRQTNSSPDGIDNPLGSFKDVGLQAAKKVPG